MYFINSFFIFFIILLGILKLRRFVFFSFFVVNLNFLVGFGDFCIFFKVVFVEFRYGFVGLKLIIDFWKVLEILESMGRIECIMYIVLRYLVVFMCCNSFVDVVYFFFSLRRVCMMVG